MVKLLRAKGARGVTVFADGLIPTSDIPGLKKAGVKAVFPPGTSTKDIVQWLHAENK